MLQATIVQCSKPLQIGQSADLKLQQLLRLGNFGTTIGLPGFNTSTIQKVAGALCVPSAQIQKGLGFEGYGTRSVPTTFKYLTLLGLIPKARTGSVHPDGCHRIHLQFE